MVPDGLKAQHPAPRTLSPHAPISSKRLMSTEKRTFLFFLLSFLILMGSQPLLQWLGLVPPPPARVALDEDPNASAEAEAEATAPAESGRVSAFAGEPHEVQAFAPEEATEPEVARLQVQIAPEPVDQVQAPEVEPVDTRLLSLGAASPTADPVEDYRLRLDLVQRGAGVLGITLAQHAAETIAGQPRETRLQLLQAADAPAEIPPPFAVDLIIPDPEGDPERARELPLNDRLWEVVPDEQGRLVRPVPALKDAGLLEGQAIEFQTTVPELGVTVQKTFTLRKGRDAAELDLAFASDLPITLAYRLQGPHGLPIEGEWYTTNYREVFFGKVSGQATEIETHQASEVVKKERAGDPIRITTLPLKYAGVENQYFAVFFEPIPIAYDPATRIDEKTVASTVLVPSEEPKADVSVAMTSLPITLAPDQDVRQSFLVYAGPKTEESLVPFGAGDLATYRKGWNIWVIGPASTFMARYVITPLLDNIYALTVVIAGLFGFARGNYGIAIILLTITVRMMLFPLSRRQAYSAKKMQDLQPQMAALREKYKDDKEKIGRETMALYRKHGVNPMGGCLLALIQMPIFFGLWQALNNSVALRGAPFLWIDNLSAPDQLFAFPGELPFLGRYFNILPFLVVSLMLVHMKLFSPPATSPEQEMSQKMMKYMMVVMAFFFYRVPSGLCLYFVTSSSWAIAERLLLPKELRSFGGLPSAKTKADEEPARAAAAGRSNSSASKPVGGWRDRLREKLEEVMEEAAKDRTHRNIDRGGNKSSRKPPPPRPRPRPRHGKRR